MQSPTEEELEESIKELTEYKNRLEKEVVSISNKLKMPQKKTQLNYKLAFRAQSNKNNTFQTK